MPENTGDLRGTEFVRADLTGARFRRTRLTEAWLQMVDLSGAVVRDATLSGVSIDGCEIDGLRIDGVEIAPLIEAELIRREPARAWLQATDPAELRTAWSALEQSWAATYDRVAAMPAGTVDISVSDEWSFAFTLRHLVFATDAWLGAILDERSFHPWGIPFADVAEFVARPEQFGLDQNATPSYEQVLALRADRVAKVREFLSDVSPRQLADEVEEPPWGGGSRTSVLRCIWVILNEECEHRRFAERDLNAIEAGSSMIDG